MPGKWKVQVVSQKHSAKARSNWRSLYSCVSWFNKALKKVPKPASLMMFFMLGDNVAHALFNIWRLLWLLRLYNTKAAHQFPWPKPKWPKISIKKIYIYSHNQCPTTTKKSTPHQNFTTIKIHIHTQLPKFFHSHAKNSYVQDKKNSHKFMPMNK